MTSDKRSQLVMSPDAPDLRSSTASPRGVGLCLILLVLSAFAIRVAVTQFAAGGLSNPPYSDEVQYFDLASSLAQGHGFSNADGTPHTYRSPGTSFLLAPLFLITGPSVVAARVYMCALNSLLVPICFYLGRAVGGRRIAWLGALAAAFMPNWVFYSGSILSDLPTATAIAAMAWLGIEGGRRGSIFYLLGAGAAWGFAVLIRPTCIVFLPGVCLWMLIAPGLQYRWRGMVAICLPMFILAGAWMLRNTLVTSQFVGPSSQGGFALWLGNNSEATGVLDHDSRYYGENVTKIFPHERYASEEQRSAAASATAKRFIRENPGRFLHLCGVRFIQLWKMYSPRVSLGSNLMMLASFGVILPFALLRMFGFAWRCAPEMLFTLLIAAQTAVHCVFTAIIRYRMPVEALVLVMGLAGLCWVYDRLRPAGKRQPLPAAAA